MPKRASKAPATSKKQKQTATVDDWLRAEREIPAQHQRRQ
jgi:hypothetical protein